jgi:hypothetical protein
VIAPLVKVKSKRSMQAMHMVRKVLNSFTMRFAIGARVGYFFMLIMVAVGFFQVKRHKSLVMSQRSMRRSSDFVLMIECCKEQAGM